MPLPMVHLYVTRLLPETREPGAFYLGAIAPEVGVKVCKQVDQVDGFHPVCVKHPVGQIADHGLALGADWEAGNLHGSLRRAEQTGQNLDERRFSGSGRGADDE